MQNHNGPKVIAVSGGKGGVGKSLVTVNLAVSLAQLGKKVLIFDADLGLANIDILLNLDIRYHLGDFLAGRKTLSEILAKGPYGLDILPAASGVRHLANLTLGEQQGLIQAFSSIKKDYNFILIDTPAGLSGATTTFCLAADSVLIVSSDEPAALTDAYASIKCLNRSYKIEKFYFVANMVSSIAKGAALFYKLQDVVDQFLELNLNHVGTIVYDDRAKEAVRKRKPICEIYPSAPSVLGFDQLANRVLSIRSPMIKSGGLNFTLENE